MKTLPLSFLSLLTSAALVHAATVVSYTAVGDPNGGADSFDGLSNVDAWTYSFSGPGSFPSNGGSFVSNSANNGGAGGGTGGAGNPAWGLYANSDTNNTSTITHAFDGGALTIGQTVSIDFDSGYIDGGSDVGIRLTSGGNFRFALSFGGGDSDFRYYDNASGFITFGQGYTDAGINIAFTLNSATGYTVIVTDKFTSATHSFSGTVTDAPDSIQVYNRDSGNGSTNDVYANNLAVVPEPGTVGLAMIGGAFFLTLFRRRRS